MSDTRPATDEEVGKCREAVAMCLEAKKRMDIYPQSLDKILARLAAAEEACRDLQQSVDGMAHERLALETENARLREALRRLVDAWPSNFTPSPCAEARRLLEAKP